MAQAFSQWLESWMTRDYPAFREQSRMLLVQSWATVRGTMVRGPEGQSDPWLQVFADRPAVVIIMGSPREVLPVLQQPLCSLPVLAVGVMLDVGALWLYDRQLRRFHSGSDGAVVHGRASGFLAACTDTGGRRIGPRHGGTVLSA